MKYESYILEGSSPKELNIEIRFNLASAKVDGAELVSLSLSPKDDTNAVRLMSGVTKVLGAMRKKNLIQFFVLSDSLSNETAESAYITNKYRDFVVSIDHQNTVFVKI